MKNIEGSLWTQKRWRRVVGVIVSVLLLAALVVSIVLEGFEWPYHAVTILLLPLICAALFFGFKMNRKVSIIFMAAVPAICFYALEGYSHLALTDMTAPIQLLNLCLFYLVFIILLFIFGKSSAALSVLTLAMMVIGLINYYVVAFRGTPVVPWDLLSVSTALSVTVNYVFSLDGRVVMITCIFVLTAVLASRTDVKIKWSVKRSIAIIASFVFCFFYVTFLQTPMAVSAFAMDDILFTPNVMYRNNGFTVSFLTNLKYLKKEVPDNYGSESVETLTHDFRALPKDTKEEYPNIVVIMNESFSDMADIADFETNEDYMPFVHSALNGELDNCVSGKMVASVLGGNTANSEFEFLTGDTMAFLPPGSIAYQQYIKDEMPNFASSLSENLGYHTIALHPYHAGGWNRNIVYPFLGFEEAYFLEDMRSGDCYLNDDVSYMREYISDESLVDMITGRYERDEDEAPLFTFAVTMQNHGGYFDTYSNFNQEIELLGVENDYNKDYMDRYLSLIKKSDTAFENLVDFFKDYDEPTIVLMFGDHQPGDYVINAIYDTNKVYPLEQQQNRYLVPFVMWANYDIEDEQIDKISANYLSTLLLEKAGLPMTGYQQWLSNLRETLPVITANVIIDNDGTMYPAGERDETPYASLLNDYATLQYNHLFDKSGRDNVFFGSGNN